jgi:3-oxo-4-pregnene-20-carboxyl-CoA dehydrogenase alpha subunit
VNTDLAGEANEFAAVVGQALDRAGGFDLVQRAQQGEPVAAGLGDLLGTLGVWDLEPRSAELDCEVAAAVCRVAGAHALPYPVAERLAGDKSLGFDAVTIVSPIGPRINLCEPSLAWAAADGAGQVARVTGIGPRLGSKIGAMVSDVELGDWEAAGDLEPLALTLPSWVLLGMAEFAFAATRQHLLDRHQFGRPLASNQALQFRMADAAAVLQGFEELAKYTLWSVITGQPGMLADALALRAAALETTDLVFRTAHQMHGAIGFCDELPLSWLSRSSQPIRRLPFGLAETESRLLTAIEGVPFAGLFTDPDSSQAALVP